MIHTHIFSRKAGLCVSLTAFTALVCHGPLYAGTEPVSPFPEAASVGVEIAVVQADGSLQTVYSHDAGRALMPASTLKLVSTATALRLCGAQTTVPTVVGYDGRLAADGTLCGDVIIRGGGDATLASEYDARPKQTFVTKAVQALTALGVKRVTGRVVGDGSLLSDEGVMPDWTWEDMGNYYAAGLYGLNYGANMYTLVLDTSRPGVQPQVVRTEPEVPGLVFDNRLLAVDYRFDSAYIYGAPHEGLRRIYGAVPHRARTFTVKGDVPDPPLMAATALRSAMLQAGMTVDGGAESDYTLSRSGQTLPPVSHICYTYQSAPLGEIARRTNVHSQNLLAEMLLRMVAVQGTATSAAASSGVSSGEARRLAVDYWRRRGLDMRGVRLYDGCGLSPNDRVTARFLVELLADMRGDEAFVNSLPVVGQEGTVRNFGAGTTLAGRARLKSGTTKQVVSYAGYVTGSDGRSYIAAVVVNNYEGRAAEVRRLVAGLLQRYIP